MRVAPASVVRRRSEFALYDEYLPRTKIVLPGNIQFLLNFNEGEGVAVVSATYSTKFSDGDDKIFGDLGNDWLVGGTGRDDIYGGWGDDLLNADDDHGTTSGTNDGPDTHPSYEDRAYGGAGRDVLIGNTGGDRLIDWVGEFNSFIVPFAPFGLGTVSRTLQPQLAEFLYALSASDGADFTRAADIGGSADPARNGEPYGELGVVRQQDIAWQDQTGGPRDPQAGNIPGGPRDVLRSASFDDPANAFSAFAPDSGLWTVQNGVLQVSASSPHTDAVAVYNIGDALPVYFEMTASLQAIKPTGGWKADTYLIFDYISTTDFKFAGIDVALNKVVMGHRDATGWHVDKQAAFTGSLKSNTFYNAFLSVNGVNATITIDNKVSLTHTFAPHIIDGYAFGLNWGLVGVGSDNSRGAYDNVRVQIVPPAVTFSATENFSDGVADLFTAGNTGTWSVGAGTYATTPSGLGSMSLLDLGPDNLGPDALLDLSAKVNTQGRAGFVFDRYSATDFKFVAIDVVTDKLIIGHYTTKSGWVIDASMSKVLNAGTDYTLTLSLKGSTVSATVYSGANPLATTGFVYNAVTVDGKFGLLATTGQASFDDVVIKTTDRSFVTPTGSPIIAADGILAGDFDADALTQSQLDTVAAAVLARWIEVLGAGDPRLAALGDIRFTIANLVGGELGYAEGNTIKVDVDAAGHGWFVDLSPDSSSEFQLRLDEGILQARDGTQAYGLVDLVTVLTHEVGHVLGFTHADAAAMPVMHDDLDPGVRYLLEALDFDANPDEPISDATLLNLARRAAALEAHAAEQGRTHSHKFDLDLGGNGAQGVVDWSNVGTDGWESSYSPFAAGKAGKAGKAAGGNFADFLFKPYRGGDGPTPADVGMNNAFFAAKSDTAGKATKGAGARV